MHGSSPKHIAKTPARICIGAQVSYVWGLFQLGSLTAALFVGPLADAFDPQIIFWSHSLHLFARLVWWLCRLGPGHWLSWFWSLKQKWTSAGFAPLLQRVLSCLCLLASCRSSSLSLKMLQRKYWFPALLGFWQDKRVPIEQRGFDWTLVRRHPYVLAFCLIMASPDVLSKLDCALHIARDCGNRCERLSCANCYRQWSSLEMLLLTPFSSQIRRYRLAEVARCIEISSQSTSSSSKQVNQGSLFFAAGLLRPIVCSTSHCSCF